MAKRNDIFISSVALAGLLKLTVPRIHQLKEIGLPYDQDSRKFPLIACLIFMLDVERSRNKTLAGETAQEKKRLMHERAERAALENERLRNKVIDAESIMQQTMEIIQQLKDGLLSIPGRVCHTIEGKSAAEIRQNLDIELKNVLNIVAEKLETISDYEKENGQKLSSAGGSGSVENQVVSQRCGVGEIQSSLAK